MQIRHNISTYSISWLASSYDPMTAKGKIDNYYIPECLEELKAICLDMTRNKVPFRIVGHTSNIYFHPQTNICNLISTRKVNKWHLDGNTLTCDCGVNVRSLARAMIEKGIEGFAGMIDLPGTVGGAIYGNSSVSHYSVSGLIDTVTILTNKGEIITLTQKDLGFQFRSSVLKRHELNGTILSCTLRINKGECAQERQTAVIVHEWRKKNQPGPLNNLGTTMILGKRTKFGLILAAIAKVLYILRKDKTDFILKKSGGGILTPYVFGLNRYMWKDAHAHDLFHRYLEVIKKLYISPKLEIEIW